MKKRDTSGAQKRHQIIIDAYIKVNESYGSLSPYISLDKKWQDVYTETNGINTIQTIRNIVSKYLSGKKN
jgi:hypothetical protein